MTRRRNLIAPVLIILFAAGLLAGCRPAEKPAQTTPALPVVRLHDETPTPEAPPPVPTAPAPVESSETKDKQIDTGFFFKDGLYVPPPYVVEVAEGGVRINGLWVRDPAPKPKENIVEAPIEDPGPFQWTPELLAKGMGGSEFYLNASMRFRYWRSKYGFDEASNRVEAYVKEQPPVIRTGRRPGMSGGVSIRYWTKDGREDGLNFPGRNVLIPLTGKRLEDFLEEISQRYRDDLAYGGLILKASGENWVRAWSYQNKVVQMFDIVNSVISDDERAAALVKAGYATDSNTARELVIGVKNAPGLKDRVERLHRAGAKE